MLHHADLIPRPDEDRMDKAPKWLTSYVQQLEQRVADLTKALASSIPTDQGGAITYTRNYETYYALDDWAIVRYRLGGPKPPDVPVGLDWDIEIAHKGSEIHVRSMDHSMVIRPHSSNVVRISNPGER